MAAREATDTGYIVHRKRLRETSLLLQVFTRLHGRFGVIARGALSSKKGGGSAYAEFTPYFLVWSGKSDLPTLVRAEPTERGLRLEAERLFSAMYLNELIVRLVHRGEGDDAGYRAYELTLKSLAGEAPIEPALRHFEALLLDACGYGMELAQAVDTGTALDVDASYFYIPERGPVSRIPPVPHRVVSGGALLALAGALPWGSTRLREAKSLMRFLIHHHLGGQALSSRELFRLSGDARQ